MNDELSDWERQRQEAEQLAALLPDEAPYAPPMQLRQPVEMAPASFDAEPDWTDALGAGTTALAGLADLALNEGKGFGQIISAGGAYGAARGEQRVRQQQAALDYEAKRAALAQKNRYDDYLYASMGQRGQNQATTHADRARSQDQRDRDLARKDTTEARQAEDQDPSEFIAWAADRGYNLHGLETMSQVRSAMGPLAKEWDLEHAGAKAGATATGRINAENALAGETGEAEATKYAAQTPAAVDRAKQIGEGKEEVSGSIARAEETQRQGRFNKFRDETEKSRPQVGIAANLDKTLAKYPSDKPGVGVWDSYKSGKLASDDDLAVRGAVTNMTDLVARVRSGAAIPPKEFENISRFVDGGEGASEQQFRVAYNAYKRTLQDEMKQQSRGREGEAREVLGEYGDWALGPKPAAAALRLGGGTAQASGAKPMGGGMVNGDAPRMRTVHPPGNLPAEHEMLTEQQAEILRRKGAQVD